MDAFTQSLIGLAYCTAKARNRRRHVSVPDLAGQIHRHWVNYRDGMIGGWAQRIYDRAKQKRLLQLVDRVDELLVHNGEFWEPPDDEDPTALRAEWVAWGIAVLHWIYLERAGKAPIPRYTSEELGAWLSERQLEQLPLFRGIL